MTSHTKHKHVQPARVAPEVLKRRPLAPPTIADVKATDPVPNPRASTTDEDIARADGEGMAPVPPPRAVPDPE